MKTIFFFLILTFQIAAENLVFIHLGKDFPPYLLTVIKQARYFNQESKIFLLVDHVVPSSLDEEQITLVDLQQIPMTNEHLRFLQSSPIDSSISNGLWSYATERFFALFDFMVHTGSEKIFHLESDSMLYMNVKELLPILEKKEICLAAPFQSQAACIPCFVYLKNLSAFTLLIDHILFELENYKGNKPHKYVNDMHTLASFSAKYGKKALTPLPTLMPEYGKFYPKRKSQFFKDNRTNLSFLSLNSLLFPKLLFDAATLGIWLNGSDRRHTPDHGPGTIHFRSLFDPSVFSFFWEKDKEGRKTPFLSFHGQTYQIVNLHFHSKMPEEYASF